MAADEHGAAPGIIPARAGFTVGERIWVDASQDHPRSRGVYREGLQEGVSRDGSSPLARGLLGGQAPPPRLQGIIPARAGFTVGGGVERDDGADHPRSRGVYADDNSAWGNEAGSSPLARGLRMTRRLDPMDRGIIPARAGFTILRRSYRHLARDHPRSRGVYLRYDGKDRRHDGSSPLARGLRGGDAVVRAGRRIIPARAGFTGGTVEHQARPGDHPRSRGVYPNASWRPSASAGSSPLARGLRCRRRHRGRACRIIPARAGFTQQPYRHLPPGRDHPRSRGVYPTLSRPNRTSGGSSPLARGLLDVVAQVGAVGRIIPARAGFTSTKEYADRTV